MLAQVGEAFMKSALRIMFAFSILMTIFALSVPALYAGNEVMGEIVFEGKSKVEKTSGVWVDGQYVGYLKELKGSKKVLLLPGEHVITVRQNGYQDFVQRVNLQPGDKRVVSVSMMKGPTGVMPAVTATVKISVNPSRAAVFVDGLFVGHVGEFEGVGRGMLVAPGPHTIKIALAGYQTFETQISPLAHQKVEVKTDLLKGEGGIGDPSIKQNSAEQGPPAPEPANRSAARTPAPSPEPANRLAEHATPPPPEPANRSVDQAPPPPPEPATPPQKQ
jgi:hypothetical protein